MYIIQTKSKVLLAAKEVAGRPRPKQRLVMRKKAPNCHYLALCLMGAKGYGVLEWECNCLCVTVEQVSLCSQQSSVKVQRRPVLNFSLFIPLFAGKQPQRAQGDCPR